MKKTKAWAVINMGQEVISYDEKVLAVFIYKKDAEKWAMGSNCEVKEVEIQQPKN